MSIELPLLLQYLEKLPLFSTKRSPQRFLQIPNGGFGKFNQKICRNIFVKSLNLHTQFDQFGCLPRTKAFAADYNPSDESNGTYYEGKMNELLNLSINLPDEGKQSKEFESGTDVDARDDQGGGNGHGGNGKGENNEGFGGSEGGDHGLLRGLEWWWWWQWQRVHKRSHKGLMWGRGEPLFLADSVAQVVAAETMRSVKPAVSLAVELYRVLALDQIVDLVLNLLMMPLVFPCLLEVNNEVTQGVYMTIGACLGVFLAVFLLAPIWWAWHCWRNSDQQDDNASDSDDDNAAPAMPRPGFVVPGYEENQL